MKFLDYFLDRPVFTWVFNLLLAGIGLLCWETLQLREYPKVTFPRIDVITSYPNASAELVETALTYPLEDRLGGLENLEKIVSQSSYGRSVIHLHFSANASLDRSMLLIREALSLVSMPKDAKLPMVKSQSVDEGLPFMILILESDQEVPVAIKEETPLDEEVPLDNFGELTHYAHLNLLNALRAVPGVAGVTIWGQPYMYEVKLDHKKLYALGVNPNSIYEALAKESEFSPAGKWQDKISITVPKPLQSIKDFEDIIIDYTDDPIPEPIRLKQVATIQLTNDTSHFKLKVEGNAGVGIAIHQSNESNPVDTSTAIRATLAELQPQLRNDLKVSIFHDQTDFIRQSLENVQNAIWEAVLCVVFIIFLFLRNLRATLVPLIAIPLSLLGGCIFLKACGFSINTLTLLGMILAIGLVVDDAIVVLENIARHRQAGLSPIEAARRGIREIGFAIIAMTLTLASVYMPLLFTAGTIGQLFREFSVALAGSVLISGVVALTLSPLVSAHMLKKMKPHTEEGDSLLLKWYAQSLNWVLRFKTLSVLLIAAAFAGIYLLTEEIPSETAPKEDRSLIGIFTPTTAGQDLTYTENNLFKIEKALPEIPGALRRLWIAGNWGGNFILPLKPHAERDQSAADIVNELQNFTRPLPSIDAYPWSYDTGLPGLEKDSSSGELNITISTSESYAYLARIAENIREMLEKDPAFPNVRQDLKLDTSSYRLVFDTHKMADLQVTPSMVARLVQVLFHHNQSLEFNKDGILYPITLKADVTPWTLSDTYIVTPNKERVPLSAIANLVYTSEPAQLSHRNQMRATGLSTELPKGMTLPEAMKKLEALVIPELPKECKLTWSGSAEEFLKNQTNVLLLFILAILFIYAILAMQFESWIDPLIILLTVPLACLGGLSALYLANGTLNIFSQIGLITLIGLITKHGILIVEFTHQLAEKMPIKEAILQAATLRLRPILMTSGAMIAGTIPLVIAGGAGYEARSAIGWVLLGGLTVGTLFTLWILPMALYLIKGKSN